MMNKKKNTRRNLLKYMLFTMLIFFVPRCKKTKVKNNKGKPPDHHLIDGTFRNLPGAPQRISEAERAKHPSFRSTMFKRLFLKEEILVPEKYQISEQAALESFQKNLEKEIAITFLGHASFLIRIGKITILTDPFLSSRAGIGFLGPKRFHSAGISVQNLPPVDLLFLSHSHYDHCDASSLKRIKNKKVLQCLCPLKLGNTIKFCGYKNVKELDWYQKIQFQDLQLTLLPSIHWSRRLGQPYNTTLWGGLLIEKKNKVIYFSGDTAYSKTIFDVLAKKIPAPDIAILPIGAYSPRWFMKASHTTPEEAVQIGKHLAAKNLVAMHWGSIVLSTEDVWEPPQRMTKAALATGYKKEQIWIMANGETRVL